MKGKRRKISSVILVLGVLLLCGALTPQQQTCTAATVWSDNFDDGNHSGWTIIHGDFGVSSNTLVPTDDNSEILHRSNVTSGTWSFDFLWNGTFAAVDYISATEFIPDATYVRCFQINFYRDTQDNSQIEIRRYLNTVMTSLITVETAFLTGLYGTWVSVDVTRDSSCEIMVYVNGVPLWEPEEDLIDTYLSSTCSYFHVHCEDQTFAFDNFVVSDTVDVTPPPPPIPGFPAAAITLGVATALGLSIAIRHQRQK